VFKYHLQGGIACIKVFIASHVCVFPPFSLVTKREPCLTRFFNPRSPHTQKASLPGALVRSFRNCKKRSFKNLRRVLLKNPQKSNLQKERYTNIWEASAFVETTDLDKTKIFGYYSVDQLLTITNSGGQNESYLFDKVGNSTSSHRPSTYDYQPLNKIASTQTATYGYDANGNTTSKSEGSSFWRYGFDYENRMYEAAARKSKVRYRYDALGRRVERNLGPTGAWPTILRFLGPRRRRRILIATGARRAIFVELQPAGWASAGFGPRSPLERGLKRRKHSPSAGRLKGPREWR
jgi:hypothetical protein